jgi:acetyltransferase
MAAAEENGLGISKFISYGNSADLTELEFLRYLKDDDETAVIAVYVENIKNGRAFMKVLREVSAKKPVVIIKSGRTSIGQRAALSHTGALAGADSVYDAAFKECGALRVESIDEMFNLCKALADLPLPGGNNVLIVTNSGGPGVMTADKGELCGLSLKEPSDAVKAELKGFLPDFASLRNPIDLTVEGTGEQYSKALATGLQDFDAAIAIYVGTPYLKALPVAEGIISAYRAANKPVLSFLQVGEDITESVNTLKYASLPVYSSGEKAAQVLARMAEYRHYLMKKPVEKEEITACGSLPGTDKMLFEADAAALLEKNGIHIPPWRFVNKRENVAEACGEIGFPLCVKIVSPQIIHKSDSGGVVLGISSAAEALNAFDSMEKAAAGLDFKGVMLYPMLKGGVEVILGISRDAQFGPVILFGLGGVYSEVFKDVALRIAPVSEEEAAEMIAGTRAYNILKGIRGRKGADLKSLAIMISRLSRLPFYYPEIAEIDLNPVFADEHGCVAADMRIIRK